MAEGSTIKIAMKATGGKPCFSSIYKMAYADFHIPKPKQNLLILKKVVELKF